MGPFGGMVGVTDVDFSADGASLYLASRYLGVWMADVSWLPDE